MFLNGFSGQSIFEDYSISFYNLFFTALPLIMMATFDWDLIDRKIVKT
jgi:phospholipid-transporting ATPase